LFVYCEVGKPEKKKGYDKHGNKVKYDPNFKKKQVPVYTREERKELRVKRRDARPNAEIVLKANTTLWSQSLSNMKGAERVERVGEILKTLEGKIGDVASKHDVSRAIQCCLKHGSKGQRAKVLGELKPHIVSLATSKYAHHLVLKLIQLGDKETQRIIRDEFSGKCVKLGLRSDAAKVIDLLYATGNAQEQQKLLAEFYGKEYIIRIKSGEAAQALSEIVAQSADVRQQVVAHIGGWIAKFVNKEMLMFRFVHTLILNYWTYGTAADHDKLLADICSNPMALHHSADGAQVLCTILSQG
jgi:pumilio family protein 6